MSNMSLAQEVLCQLGEQGVQTLCICPGARNAPFVELLEETQAFEVLSFYDERSAGFFALGAAKRQEKPVVVITTSGTAVSELLSPVIEAHYSSVPLVVLSADRPKRLRGTGAPQTIEQASLFQNYVENSFDIEGNSNLRIEISQRSPSHINICFDEPLIDEKPADAFEFKMKEQRLGLTALKPEVSLSHCLVVVSGLKEKSKKHVADQLSKLDVPIFVEAGSGLKNSSELSNLQIQGGEKMAVQMLRSGEVKSVLRIGDIPLGRYWRDLDAMNLPVVSLSENNFSGLSHGKLFWGDLQNCDLAGLDLPTWEWRHWQKKSIEKQKQILQIADQFFLSESSFIKDLSMFSIEGGLYLGNSLPVRLWDLMAQQSLVPQVNRGANGIDGQISSGFGGFQKNSKNWLIIGDLTALYDFSAFWSTPYLKENKIDVNLVVINNGGGQIFNRIFENSLFRNEHQLDFANYAKHWGWSYQKVNRFSEIDQKEGLNFIEFKPDKNQSQEFWKGYDLLWD